MSSSLKECIASPTAKKLDIVASSRWLILILVPLSRVDSQPSGTVAPVTSWLPAASLRCFPGPVWVWGLEWSPFQRGRPSALFCFCILDSYYPSECRKVPSGKHLPDSTRSEMRRCAMMCPQWIEDVVLDAWVKMRHRTSPQKIWRPVLPTTPQEPKNLVMT